MLKVSNRHIAALSGAALLLSLAACSSDSDGWSVKGRIDNAAGKQLIVETGTFVGWTPVDTVEIASDGSFTASGEAKGYPDIYRLCIDGSTVYFPIDSVETITIEGSLPALESNYTLGGSTDAEMIMAVDREISAVVARVGIDSALTDPVMKRSLTEILLRDPKSITAYYIVSRRLGGRLIFDPTNRNDHRVIGAVANSFTHYRPTDPRTSMLANLYLSHRRVARTDTIVGTSIGHYPISLYDKTGTRCSLDSVIARNKVTILNFTSYDADQSPAFNRELHDIYTRWHDRGVEIYQVGVTADAASWRAAARPLPWVTVVNAPEDGTAVLSTYNVVNLPVTFVINADGDITERVDDPADLSAAIIRSMK